MMVIIVMVNWSYHDKYCIKNSVPVHSPVVILTVKVQVQ